MSIFKRNKITESRAFEIPGIGYVHYLHWPEKKFWMGDVGTIGPNKIELSIETYGEDDPTIAQIELIQQLPRDYQYFMNLIHNYLDTAFNNVSLGDITRMYFLSAIELGRDEQSLLFTLEPTIYAKSVYDHFQRFTIVNKKLIKYTED